MEGLKKFKSGELHENHAKASCSFGNHLSIRCACAEVAGHRTFLIMTSSQQSDN